MCSHFFLHKNENESIMLTSDFRRGFLHKSISPFENWTKKMSKNENPKYFCVKTVDFHPLLRILLQRF
jgi:hypothetical protein